MQKLLDSLSLNSIKKGIKIVAKSQISIMGCGWLGLQLAEYLIEIGHTIKGSTSSFSKLKTLSSKGIIPYHLHLDEKGVDGDFYNFLKGSEIVIFNIPPGLRKNPNKNHFREVEHFVNQLKNQALKKLLFISSTSVFKDDANFTTITETQQPNGITQAAKQLIAIEQMFQNNTAFKTTILRFSGLFGSNRHPGNSLSGKKNLKNGNAPVNLIHRNDCIAIISQLIERNIWGDVFNASFPAHPLKKEYYTNYCKANFLTPPHYDLTSISKGKYIDSNKLVQLLKYSFKHKL